VVAQILQKDDGWRNCNTIGFVGGSDFTHCNNRNGVDVIKMIDDGRTDWITLSGAVVSIILALIIFWNAE
jgi:hypothetical protein